MKYHVQMSCFYDELHLGPIYIKRFYVCVMGSELPFLSKELQHVL